ncbi:MAG: 1-phosphofructokinase [Clostridia bacterium]|nr:1-phosphofructokinase [Clostridia bacterium]MBQ4157890.1 1-phosphofructokinase [Clostridia bacterium]
MIYTITLNPARDRTVVIPDFAAGKVNRIQSFRDDPGGKGINVSKIIHTLGGRSCAMGILGGNTGKYIKNCLNDMGVENDFVITQKETRTNIKVVDTLNHVTTDINEPGAPVSKRVLSSVMTKLTKRVQPGDIVVFAGKIPEGASAVMIHDWTQRLKEKDVRVFLDADSRTLAEGVKAGPYLIKPNESELSQLLGKELESLSDIYCGAKSVIDHLDISIVAVSMGADGALFVTKDAAYRAEGLKVHVLSTVGAGDAMTAALAYGIDAGMPLSETIKLAMAASAASVEESGTQCPPLYVIEKLKSEAKVYPYNSDNYEERRNYL